MSLLRVVPLPTPVTLGGRPFLATEFRLLELAELQAWAASIRPDSYEARAFRLEFGPRDRQWKRVLSEVIDLADDPAGAFAAAIESDAGVARQVWLALRRHSPGMDAAACEALIAKSRADAPLATEANVRRILRAAWGVTGADMVRRMVDGPDGGAGQEPDWPALYHRYLTTVTGPAPPFDDLTLGQLRAWLAGGVGADEDRADFAEVAARRAAFWSDLE